MVRFVLPRRRFLLFFMIALSLLATSGYAQDNAITLDFYYPTAVDAPINEIMEGYAQQFEAANPGVNVNPVYTGSYTDTRQAIQTELQGGSAGPDVGVLLSTDLYSLAEEGYVVPAEECFAGMADSEGYLADFFPAFMANSMDEEGTVWSIPFQRSTPILYYNKDLFEQAGLDPEQPPRNRDELLEYARQLNIPRERWGLLIPVAGGFPIWIFESFAMANGSPLGGGSPAQVNFNTPEVADALQFLVDLGGEYGVMPAGGSAWGDTPSAFTSGQAAMIYHTTGTLTNILANADFEVGTAFLPSGPAGEDGTGYGTPTGGGNLYLFANTSPEERNAACRWIEFLSSPEVQADWTANTGYIAVTQSAWETETLQNLVEERPQYAVARDQLDVSSQEFASYRVIDIQNIINNTLDSIISGERTDIDAALEEAQSQIDSLLAEYQ